MRTTKLISALISVTAVMSGCNFFNPNRAIITAKAPTRLILPSPEVERLLAMQRVEDAKVDRFWKEKHTREEGIARIKQIDNTPGSLYPGRKAFFEAIARQPALFIAADTYVRLLEDSNVRCSNPLFTTKFIKVAVTSGSFEGRVGWVCEDDVARTVTMP